VGPARRLRASVAVGLLIPQLTGCYQYVPTSGSALSNGATVSVGVTDAGRAALSEHVGPGIRRIEGRVVSSTDSSLVLSVTAVDYIDRPVPAPWGGEQLVLSRNIVSEIREKRLSRTRSWLLAGVIAVAAVAVSQLAIDGFGGDVPSDKPGGEPGQQQ